MFEEILRLIQAHEVIILHRHSQPDGDALGSQIGLKHLLLANFPGKRVYMAGDAAGRYAFMADSVMDEIPDALYPQALADHPGYIRRRPHQRRALAHGPRHRPHRSSPLLRKNRSGGGGGQLL